MIEHILRALARRCDGPVLHPTDPAYDQARTLFNAMIDRRPAAIVQAVSAADVAAAVAAAREAGVPLAVRGGGHSVAGMSVCDGGIVCDLRRLGAVDADPARGLARAGGGATWAAFDRATQAHGLAAVGGRVSSTGVAGLTLGGGSGWLERRFGLAVRRPRGGRARHGRRRGRRRAARTTTPTSSGRSTAAAATSGSRRR